MFFLAGCVPYQEEVIKDVNLDFKDPVLQKIKTLQDGQRLDSLFLFFKDKNPAYRYAAAIAFGSIRDSIALDSLSKLLKDPIEKVRTGAAFAIGQIGSARGEMLLLQAFEQGDTAGYFKHSNAAVLEAVGKCGTEKNLQALATISTYRVRDTALLEGQAWGIYRYALRNIVHIDGTKKMVEMASDLRFPASARMIAANYLSRTKNIDLSEYAQSLVSAFTKETDPRIRMALAVALGKTKSDAARDALVGLLASEQDYRVKCNMLRALANFDYATVKDVVWTAVRDKNIHVASTAAAFFIEKGTEAEARLYFQVARDTLPWQVQMPLFAAAHRYLPAYFEDAKGFLNYEIRRRFEASRNAYEKAAALQALSEYGWNFRYVIEKAMVADAPAVRIAGVQAVAKMCDSEGFDSFFGLGARQVRREIAYFLQDAVNTGDPGLIAEAAILLRNKKMDFKSVMDSLTFLDRALAGLKLPGQIETYNELKKTIDILNGRPESAPKKPDFNHPIDWKLINEMTETTRARIETKKGTIVLQLFPMEAPGSVANFIKLSKDGFFDGKNFHRVVPNFVIQGGCPRGDGYGGLDYTLRSELTPLHYDNEGYVGMASSGNHTEGTQFFITHSPTPHLDGNYTIFAKVEKGMDVVHSIQAGDVIEKVEIDNAEK